MMSNSVEAAASLAALLKVTPLARRILPPPVWTWLSLKRYVTVTPTDELRDWYRNVLCDLKERREDGMLGDYLEFGVFRGASLVCMGDVLQELRIDDVRLFGFDSFEGLPSTSVFGDRDLPWQPGDYASDYEDTQERITRAGVDPRRVFLVKGWYEDTLTVALREHLGIRKASVIMIDCDLYSSTKEALEFCAPLIEDEVFIFFDDWDAGVALADRNLGEKRAFDEFLAAREDLVAEEYGTYHHTEMKNAFPAKIFRVMKIPADGRDLGNQSPGSPACRLPSNVRSSGGSNRA